MKYTKNSPILIIGAGSIGRRHLGNLKTLGHNRIVLYRTGNSTLPEEEIKDIEQEYDFKKALAQKPIATIIANPTSLHIPFAKKAAMAGSHLFLEKPISNSMEGVKELRRIVLQKKLIVQVGFQFRFHPGLLKLKTRLEKREIGQILSVQVHWGEFLPSWHPWEDYRKSYSARKDLGGGVLLTLCHPFDYLRWLFGEVDSISAFTAKNSQLELSVEDTADVLLRFKSGVLGNVHLDYLQHPSEHYIRVICQNGIIHLNFLESKFDRNKMFIEEMKSFMSCIKNNKQPNCSLDDGIATLKTVLCAKKSAEMKKTINII